MLVVFGVSALAYFVAPAASLRIVGIASDPTERFLLRTLAAALLAFVVPLWLAATRPSTSLRNGLVWGAITYLVASSLVDLAAYMGGIVSGLSVPSAAGYGSRSRCGWWSCSVAVVSQTTPRGRSRFNF